MSFFLDYHETFENIVIYGFSALFFGFVVWCVYQFVYRLYQEIPIHYKDTFAKKMLTIFGCLLVLATLVTIIFALTLNNMLVYVSMAYFAVILLGVFLSIANFYYQLIFKNISNFYAKILGGLVCAVLSLLTLSVIGILLQKFGIIDLTTPKH